VPVDRNFGAGQVVSRDAVGRLRFIVQTVRPYYKNFNKRLVKTPKLYFVDTGLPAALLGVESAQSLNYHSQRGPLFEAWVYSELLKSVYNRGKRPEVYFWRDRAGHEVDFVEERGSRLQAIEVKSGTTINSDYFAGLRFFQKLAEESRPRLVLLYGGDSSQNRSGVDVVSWKNIDGL
jgi:predicted AAA+ superfamily ATPase